MPARKHVHVTPSKWFQCSFKITPTQVCGERFSNIYLLRKHRKTMGHQRKEERRSQAVDPDIELYISRVKRAIAIGTARETDTEEGGKGDGEMESVVEGVKRDGEKESVVEGRDEGDSEMESVVEGGVKGDDENESVVEGGDEEDREMESVVQEDNGDSEKESVVEGRDKGDSEKESVNDSEGGDERDGEMESVGGGDEGDGEKETVVDGGGETEKESLADGDSERESDVEGDTEMKELNMCGLTEEDDEEDEVWIECTKCLKWVHKSCLPPHHPHDADDDNFLRPDCTTKKPKRMSALSFLNHV